MAETAFVAEQFDETYPPGVEDHFWNHARNFMILAALRCAEADKGRFGTVLEIGCGRGVVLHFLRAHGVDCRGVEPGASGQSDPSIFAGVDCFALPQEFRDQVDCLLLLDVLEHIERPEDFLRDVRASYRNARALIVTVPARQELWSNYDDRFGHFRRYTPDGLDVELRAGGFPRPHSAYVFHALYPVMWLLVKLAGRRETVVATPRPVALHRLLSLLFRIERALLPGSLPGTSVLCRAY